MATLSDLELGPDPNPEPDPEPGHETSSERSETMQPGPNRPAKFGGNKETVVWLETKFNSGIKDLSREMKDMKVSMKKTDTAIQAYLDFQRTNYKIPPGIPLNSASDWRAFRNTGTGTADPDPPEVEPLDPAPNPEGETNPRPPRTRTTINPNPDPDPDPSDDSSSDDDNPLGPRPPGPPRSPNRTRGDTPHSQITVGGTYKIKREDIGSFDPEYNDPNDVGVVTEGKNLVFTDVYSFSDRIESFLEDPTTSSSNEGQILAMFQTLLTGPAVLWWNNEITPRHRRRLRRAGLTKILDQLQERFALDAGIATQRFEQTTLTLKDIKKNQHELPQFIQRKLRYARAMGILTSDNTNWRGVMTQIRNSMSLEVKQFIRPLARIRLSRNTCHCWRSHEVTLMTWHARYLENVVVVPRTMLRPHQHGPSLATLEDTIPRTHPRVPHILPLHHATNHAMIATATGEHVLNTTHTNIVVSATDEIVVGTATELAANHEEMIVATIVGTSVEVIGTEGVIVIVIETERETGVTMTESEATDATKCTSLRTLRELMRQMTINMSMTLTLTRTSPLRGVSPTLTCHTVFWMRDSLVIVATLNSNQQATRSNIDVLVAPILH
ncbi:hypothetical protein F5Y12DRAFT_778731 [Xylaria sp. FL1777]|nr:hypothetical protein F5Y12DRAFT_778731 [Xylaria sp. FL1777]